MIFSYGEIKIEIPDEYNYVYYATFIAGEWDLLKLNKNDVVLDAGAFIGDFTLKIAKKVKKVVSVEPLPWAFELLKKNVEINKLNNVILVNKALYDKDGIKLKLENKGTGSKISESGDIEVETVTIDSLGEFDVVKMDIEGAEGIIIKEDSKWLDNVREIELELHGKENIERIPKILKNKGFKIKYLDKFDLIKNTIKNILSHPYDFIKAEMNTKILLKTLNKNIEFLH
ncbi:uncharacterized SAM-dependent methyltransferase SSO0838, FkbM family [Nanoarchaeota archaeon]